VTLGRIVGVGARSPLGLDARGVALAHRAQKLAPRRLILRDQSGSSYGTARAACIDDEVFGFERIVELGGPPLAESVATSLMPVGDGVALHLAVPDARPTPDERLGRPLLVAIAERAGVRIDPKASTFVTGGHAGFGVALQRALASSRESGRPAIAGAADSHHLGETLEWLAREHRLHGPGVGDGFIPSEGAAFVVVSATSAGPRLATVLAVELGADECDEDGEDPPIGAAMTRAVDRALDAAPDLGWILCDVNGERHRVKEWSFVVVRLRHRIDPETWAIDRPYQESGDAGAATGALYASFATMAWQAGFAPSHRVMLALRAEGAARAAIVLEAP
jgi:3-oxoacyl-[acyl-carrier-protein] synthase-1